MDKQCLNCQQMYFSKRADSKYCSAKCRKAANRDMTEDLESELVTDNLSAEDWHNSAETKTQVEIEAHYTLANFPRVKYYTQNGGGSGAYSPYNKYDPRAKAYIDV